MENGIAMVKQIIVVTDGESNIGGDPVAAAKAAYNKNIIVSTIGIIDNKCQKEKPYEEVANIAAAGGGKYEYTYLEQLSHTIHSLSYKTVSNTIQEAVNKQLRELIGNDINQMPPESRSKILNYIDEYSDDVSVCCCILMDCSGSMGNKIHSARNSILDLMDSLKNRRGNLHLAVMGYPGIKGEECSVLYDFNDESEDMERSLYQMKPNGGTPTAAAINFSVKHMESFLKKTLDGEIHETMELEATI
ncbi:vWA domain-containing protein [Alkaliphilus peptidifermentans]|uniref:Ca-activated chloride channel family protein n=1 Tax=Alkaliphilus peptidifermentans DSM 18978 TaxID=1120976 RepID=A0A1G5KGY2_9FIRM|nr:VWA domain-containing protein [Alkaliphilus peptidifermentans]SCY99862.1 Ca-activated chloride channel family protein [Alkaliphilus peptidifermentans DSM 18978]